MSKSTKVLPQKKKKSSAVRPVEANTITTTTTTTTATTTKNTSSPKSTSVNVGSSDTSSIDDVASRVAASIEHIFDRYDADCNGNIDSVELEALLKDVNRMAGGNEFNLTQEVQEVLNAIGTEKENSDVDGLSINKDAFVEWTLTKLIKGYGGGLHTDSENRKPKRKLSKALPLQLERFLSSMGKVSLQIAAASSTTPRLYRLENSILVLCSNVICILQLDVHLWGGSGPAESVSKPRVQAHFSRIYRGVRCRRG